MNETLEVDQEVLAVVRNSLPATQEELATMLNIASSRVPGLIRKLRRSGYTVAKSKGVYRGANQLDEHELAIQEHRYISTVASWAATAAAQFPTPERQMGARIFAEELARLDADIGKHRRARVLEARITRDQQELAGLNA